MLDLYNGPNHPFFGKPSKQVDSNWEELLQWSDIRVPRSEIHRLDREADSVWFPDQEGGGLRIAHSISPPSLLVHCLGLLKEAVMCQGDLTLLTMRWSDLSPLANANWSTPHSCVDWSRLDSWASRYHVNVSAPGMLVHPKFRPVFDENGKSRGSRTGVD
ncbi:hypothetical protein OPT61_g2246 [Boeremia exigua]|uniref:Uncharacterized protein n=1 Tax=Boeremia exigua TaxID=749465 RepID=A0ACC2IME4_9PLEO|nr:hypothetical protein OPT61_g2246 [Boeremia exigua]